MQAMFLCRCLDVCDIIFRGVTYERFFFIFYRSDWQAFNATHYGLSIFGSIRNGETFSRTKSDWVEEGCVGGRNLITQAFTGVSLKRFWIGACPVAQIEICLKDFLLLLDIKWVSCLSFFCVKFFSEISLSSRHKNKREFFEFLNVNIN